MNSKKALLRALDNGFGVETDLRDMNSELVISHDPPLLSENPPRLSFLLSAIEANNYAGRVALNIKSDGLSRMISAMLEIHYESLKQLFVFDMSTPDTISYASEFFPNYARVSELESEPVLHINTCGIWIDSFDGSYPQVQKAEQFLDKGLRVAIVSSELHKRSKIQLWTDIISSGIYTSSQFEICTDFPLEAAEQFNAC